MGARTNENQLFPESFAKLPFTEMLKEKENKKHLHKGTVLFKHQWFHPADRLVRVHFRAATHDYFDNRLIG